MNLTTIFQRCSRLDWPCVRSRYIATCLALISLAMSGCATYGQDEHFAKNPILDASERAAPAQKDVASVYVIRPKPWGASLSYLPVSLEYYAANDKLVATMPIGTYIHLRLPPGQHRVSLLGVGLGLNLGIEVIRRDVTLNVEPGQRYFVSTIYAFPRSKFQQVGVEVGERLLKEAKLAKMLYGGATIDEFTSRVRGTAVAAKDKQLPLDRRISAALPTSDQVTTAVENIATIAFAILVIAAAVVGAAGSGSGGTLALQEPPPRVQYEWIAPQKQSISVPLSGTSVMAARPPTESRLRNIMTGVTYTVSDSRVVGSDGTRYRIYGNQIVSDSGEWFQRTGNMILTGDGRLCRISSDRIDCDK